MTIIRAANGFAVDQVPIEQIETGDTVLTHLPDGSPYTFVVEINLFDIDKAAGTATWTPGRTRDRHPRDRRGRHRRSANRDAHPSHHPAPLSAPAGSPPNQKRTTTTE
jgi:hypothetical protein